MALAGQRQSCVDFWLVVLSEYPRHDVAGHASDINCIAPPNYRALSGAGMVGLC